ncbi:MAG: FtsX-like permease family protein [Ruminococcaceae bacterium]|nr:FtsX-like permease family protein [Oscillospiraceae bacterium]
MFFYDYLRFSFKGLFSKKARFFLTVLSIFVGVVSIIVISSIGSSGQNAINMELENLGLNGTSIKSKKYNLTTKDVENVKEYLGSKYLVSSMSKEIATGIYQSKELNLFLCGGETDALDILNMEIVYGRGIRDKDVKENRKNLILSKNNSKKIFGKENSVGEKITILTPFSQNEFTVVGIVDNSNIYDMVSENIPPFLYVPSSAFLEMFKSEFVGEISVLSKNEEDVSVVSENVITYMEKENDGKNIFYFENMNSYKKSISNVVGIVALIITLIGAVSLVVGGISVMNTMLISVNERKREIGLKKALGSTNGSIMFEFLIETLIIVLISCIMGIGLGLGISYLLMKSYGIKLIIDFKNLILAVVFSLFIGVVFGVYPALKASRLNPVESLKG